MRTHVRISKSNLLHNLKVIRDSNPACEIMAMVKANAYGHGVPQISAWLFEAGIKKFGVATVDEALEIQNSIEDSDVFLTGGYFEEDEIRSIVDNNWIPLVSDTRTLKMMDKESKKQSKISRVHLKFETGMHRFGLDPKLNVDPALYPNLKIEGLCTHMASDVISHPNQHRQQQDVFERLVTRWVEKHGMPKHIHYANTGTYWGSSSSLGPVLNADPTDLFAYGMTAVRLGLGLYGYSPVGSQAAASLKPILTWKAKILQRKKIYPGDCVGYGFTFEAKDKREVAIMGVGYADGLNRLLSNKGWMLLEGISCPIIGRISMDSCAIDVTDACKRLGSVGCDVGRDAVIIGQSGDEKIGADDVANMTGTVAYEVLINIGGRVERVYIG